MSTICFAREAPLVASRHFYRYRRLVRRRTLLQPGVSSTLRRTRREIVASCESNLGYPKPSLIPVTTLTTPALTPGLFIVHALHPHAPAPSYDYTPPPSPEPPTLGFREACQRGRRGVLGRSQVCYGVGDNQGYAQR